MSTHTNSSIQRTILFGDTYPHREGLKKLGGIFRDGHWHIPNDRFEDAKRLIADPEGTVRISRLSRSKEAFHDGDIVKEGEKYLKVIRTVRSWQSARDAEEMDNFEVSEMGGAYTWSLLCVEATEAESRSLREADEAKAAKIAAERAQRALVRSIVDEVTKTCEFPLTPGLRIKTVRTILISAGRNIYGGGAEFCRDDAGNWWYVKGNGGDGDAWGSNNLPGAMAWLVPATSPLWAQIDALPDQVAG